MITLTTSAWSDYELITTGNGYRLERFGQKIIYRPDPNILWEGKIPEPYKKGIDGHFEQNSGWQLRDPKMENGWPINFGDNTFVVKPTPFRHMGLFPEQASHWQWLQEKIASSPKKVSVLNLFAYTGASSIVAAKAGAEVCHVDASKGSIYWAKDNAKASGLPDTAIRWIEDDVLKFLRREVRRAKKYDLILLDPPVFGRGPKGEIFRLEERLQELLELTAQLLPEKPLGFLLNFYATPIYPASFLRLAETILAKNFPSIELGELCLAETFSGNRLSTGFFLRS